MITVKDWMSKPVITIKPDVNILAAAELMTKHNIGCVVVSEDGKKPKGILTERDILGKIIAGEQDPKTTPVGDVMTKKVMTVDVKTSLLDISKIMSKNELRRVLVAEDGKMIGIITSRDLLQLMAG
ncbi:CBS domain-containing protein [Candidatus Woesearchaeota archaeon]|nr:CBS domain-containing protein [Candidatus Woesearchaeota archaeon]